MNKTYQLITDQLVESLETCDDWSIPWRRVNLGLPQNPKTGTVYSGINRLILAITAIKQGFDSPYWVTYKQAQAIGGHVRKGERSTAICFFKQWERTNSDGETESIPMARSYRVFNVSQCDGLDVTLPEIPAESTSPSAILEWCEGKGARIEHGGNAASYTPSIDVIHMPHRSQFHSDDAYASTLLHELTHWTKSRVNREAKDYAFEELVAELGSVFLCSHHGISYDPEHHASYLKSWLRALDNDRRYIVRAASLAQKASDYLIESESVARAA